MEEQGEYLQFSPRPTPAHMHECQLFQFSLWVVHNNEAPQIFIQHKSMILQMTLSQKQAAKLSSGVSDIIQS